MENDKIKEVVKKSYSKIASQDENCGCNCNCGDNLDNKKIAKSIGYSNKEIDSASDANLGLGCGNPVAIGNIKEGDIVLDLGSGAGFDCFLASKKVGNSGKVIGVDMTEEMIERATANAKKYGYKNVQFKLGEIENLPIDDNSIDVVISNCVINLVPDKVTAFNEMYRVLKQEGKVYISDIVLLKNLPDDLKNDEKLLVACVGGALLKDDYLEIIKKAGFKVKILDEDIDISKRQYQSIPLESLKIEAWKIKKDKL